MPIVFTELLQYPLPISSLQVKIFLSFQGAQKELSRVSNKGLQWRRNSERVNSKQPLMRMLVLEPNSKDSNVRNLRNISSWQHKSSLQESSTSFQPRRSSSSRESISVQSRTSQWSWWIQNTFRSWEVHELLYSIRSWNCFETGDSRCRSLVMWVCARLLFNTSK